MNAYHFPKPNSSCIAYVHRRGNWGGGGGGGGGGQQGGPPPTIKLGGYLFTPQLFATELNSNFEVM